MNEVEELKNRIRKLEKALLVTTKELEDWFLRGGSKNAAYICNNNKHLLGQVDP